MYQKSCEDVFLDYVNQGIRYDGEERAYFVKDDTHIVCPFCGKHLIGTACECPDQKNSSEALRDLKREKECLEKSIKSIEKQVEKQALSTLAKSFMDEDVPVLRKDLDDYIEKVASYIKEPK